MSKIPLEGIPSLPTGRIVQTLADAYCAVIGKGAPLNILPAVMLWGPPGIGKSQAVRQLADTIGARTGKKTHVTDVRLLLFNPVDLRGIPTANADKTLAIWLKPQIFQMDESADTVNILFLDEISAAPPSVQAAAYQITLDRVVGEHRLPDNCIVIAAGNRTTDKSVAYKMPKALANRLMHFSVEGSFDSWKEWAVARGVHPKVVGFLSFRNQHLMAFDAASEDLAYATPRSWEMVSNVLRNVNEDVHAVFPMIAGLVGTGTAIEFRTWAEVYDELPKVADIFDGKMPRIPRGTDALYALTASMTAYAQDHKDQVTRIANSIRYAEKLPPDFAAMLMKDYMYIAEDYRKTLMQIPEFAHWLSVKGRWLSGAM